MQVTCNAPSSFASANSTFHLFVVSHARWTLSNPSSTRLSARGLSTPRFSPHTSVARPLVWLPWCNTIWLSSCEREVQQSQWGAESAHLDFLSIPSREWANARWADGIVASHGVFSIGCLVRSHGARSEETLSAAILRGSRICSSRRYAGCIYLRHAVFSQSGERAALPLCFMVACVVGTGELTSVSPCRSPFRTEGRVFRGGGWAFSPPESFLHQ